MSTKHQFPDVTNGNQFNIDAQPDKVKTFQVSDSQKEIKKDRLANKLNYINFNEGIILATFKHSEYDIISTVSVSPLPSDGDSLICLWPKKSDIHYLISEYKLQDVRFPDGQDLLIVVPKSAQVTQSGLNILLPERCISIRARKKLRYPCQDIQATVIQNGILFSGFLVDFGGSSFRIELHMKSLQRFRWLDDNNPVSAILANGYDAIYAGECKIIRLSNSHDKQIIVLKPLDRSIKRIEPKQYRSPRHRLFPSPKLIFTHPITNKNMCLNIIEISGSGFLVEEPENCHQLISGLMIPSMQINFTNSFNIRCSGQVIHTKISEDDLIKEYRTCGIVYLDMNPEDHTNLLALLSQAKDKRAYLSNVADLDALWRFFFETGFIYPKKYSLIKNNKEQIRAAYKKLYTESPSVARHFIYQDSGRILGHIATLRYFENTWMIHHHTANTSELNSAGIKVLSQIHHYLNDTYELYSADLDFVFTYFRPENKFPMRVFGGAAKHMRNSKASFVDTYAYLSSFNKSTNIVTMPLGWELTEARAEDLMAFENLYENETGGLMIKALGLEPGVFFSKRVTQEFRKYGFKRERYVYSLKHKCKVKAIALVNISDIGLNLSELLNCIKILVLDPFLPKDLLQLALSILSTWHTQIGFPVLIYPVSYADAQLIKYDKVYSMFTVNLAYFDSYLKYIDRLLRTF